MYEHFYGLAERPFRAAPDPSFLHWCEGHTLALTMLRYGVLGGAPLTLFTGGAGTGKTVLLRHLLADLDDAIDVALISNLMPGRGPLLHWILVAMGEEVSADTPYVAQFARFQERVIEAYGRGRRVVVVIDEAQNLGCGDLEELRMLMNINAEKDDLLQIVLIGQPQLRAIIGRPDLAAFAQRIGSDFRLEPMEAADTARYLHHRLSVAGAAREIFTPCAAAAIHTAAGGVPRLVSTLADLCLVAGYAEDCTQIGDALVSDFLASARRRGIYPQFHTPSGPALAATETPPRQAVL